MTSITAGLDHLIEKMVATDRRMARRTGQHIDQMMAGLAELSGDPPFTTDEIPALPPSAAAGFKSITDANLKRLLKAYGVKGYTQRKGYRLKKADRVALAVEHGIPALSYDFLLSAYLGGKCA